MQLNSYIDHTLLKPTATPAEIAQLCTEAQQHQFHAVCVNGCHVALARSLLDSSPVRVAAVVGFPLGAASQAVKLYEAQQCLQDGADEIDLVLNLGWLKAGQDQAVQDEIGVIKQTLGSRRLKVILETSYLTDAEKQRACQLAVAAGADFVKTSTGFGPGGATFADVALLKQTVGERAQVKASGGIKQVSDALKFIQLGATRLGTSTSVHLITAYQSADADRPEQWAIVESLEK